jgi:hypothetical protein
MASICPIAGNNSDRALQSTELITAATRAIEESAGLRLQSQALRNAHREEMVQLRLRMETLRQTLGSFGATV